jgi:uncharacterized membrane protein
MSALHKPDSFSRTLGKYVAPPRFVIFILLLPIGFWIHQHVFPHAKYTDSASIAFDVAALLFLVSLTPLFRQSGPEAIRGHADAYDANRLLILIMTTLMTIAVLVVIAGELPAAKQGNPWAIARLVSTLTLIWVFTNTIFALHYAHEYYTPPGEGEPDGSGSDCGGLDFPGDGEPDYSEFIYFSFTLGMTFQTSDVSITSSRIRNIALLQCFISFIFNLGVIAFTINALGGAG